MRHELSGLGALTALRRGRVVAFDADRGLGELAEKDGGRYGFHAVTIADGSRQISPGTAVVFRLLTSPLGTLEAADLVALQEVGEAR